MFGATQRWGSRRWINEELAWGLEPYCQWLATNPVTWCSQSGHPTGQSMTPLRGLIELQLCKRSEHGRLVERERARIEIERARGTEWHRLVARAVADRRPDRDRQRREPIDQRESAP